MALTAAEKLDQTRQQQAEIQNTKIQKSNIVQTLLLTYPTLSTRNKNTEQNITDNKVNKNFLRTAEVVGKKNPKKYAVYVARYPDTALL